MLVIRFDFETKHYLRVLANLKNERSLKLQASSLRHNTIIVKYSRALITGRHASLILRLGPFEIKSFLIYTKPTFVIYFVQISFGSSLPTKLSLHFKSGQRLHRQRSTL